jgi:hypothetical protein
MDHVLQRAIAAVAGDGSDDEEPTPESAASSAMAAAETSPQTETTNTRPNGNGRRKQVQRNERGDVIRTDGQQREDEQDDEDHEDGEAAASVTPNTPEQQVANGSHGLSDDERKQMYESMGYEITQAGQIQEGIMIHGDRYSILSMPMHMTHANTDMRRTHNTTTSTVAATDVATDEQRQATPQQRGAALQHTSGSNETRNTNGNAHAISRGRGGSSTARGKQKVATPKKRKNTGATATPPTPGTPTTTGAATTSTGGGKTPIAQRIQTSKLTHWRVEQYTVHDGDGDDGDDYDDTIPGPAESDESD